MKRTSRTLLAVALGLLLTASNCSPDTDASNGTDAASAGENAVALSQEPIPDCYGRSRLGIAAPETERAIFVMVDQTTGLDDQLRRTVMSNMIRLIQPGTSFAVSTFSAFGNGHYTTVVEAGAVNRSVTDEDRPSVSVNGLRRLDRCLERQMRIARAHAQHAVERAMEADASSFTASDIMASLAHLSESVRASRGDRLVIVVSDLLEHSAATTFYSNRDLRLINPSAELAKAAENRLLGDFGGARVAVIGAGMLSPETRSTGTRDSTKVVALQSFWESWFQRSNAHIAQFGRPDLVNPLDWQTQGTN